MKSNVMFKKINVSCNNETISCLIDSNVDNNDLNTVILHGGGPSSKENTEYLIPVLQENNKFSVRFDFSGQGESSGDLLKSSLQKRFIETKQVISKLLKKHNNITIIGTSMAGHIACALASIFSVSNLILFCPAVYSIKAWDKTFGNGFTEIIRSNESYLHNNISELLSNFSGRIMLILAENDQVIPSKVVELYKRELKLRKNSKIHIIKNCPHPIHRWIINNKTEQNELLVEIDSFLGNQKLSNN